LLGVVRGLFAGLRVYVAFRLVHQRGDPQTLVCPPGGLARFDRFPQEKQQ